MALGCIALLTRSKEQPLAEIAPRWADQASGALRKRSRVPAELVSKSMDLRIRIDDDDLNTSNLREVAHMLGGYRIAVTGMMSSPRIDPASNRRRKVRFALP